MHGTMEIADQGLKGDITIVTARPDKMDMVLDLAGIGKIRSGAGGGTAWDSSAMQGPRVLEGEERDQRLRSARVDAFVNWRETYGDVKVDGEDTINGKACWRLIAKPPKATKTETLWFDKQTGFLVKSSSVIQSQMGEIPAESFYSDYREVNGMKAAFKIKQSLGPQVLETTFDKVTLNPDLPPGQFDPPAEIQALLKK
jgi:hypothetical protein